MAPESTSRIQFDERRVSRFDYMGNLLIQNHTLIVFPIIQNVLFWTLAGKIR